MKTWLQPHNDSVWIILKACGGQFAFALTCQAAYLYVGWISETSKRFHVSTTSKKGVAPFPFGQQETKALQSRVEPLCVWSEESCPGYTNLRSPMSMTGPLDRPGCKETAERTTGTGSGHHPWTLLDDCCMETVSRHVFAYQNCRDLIWFRFLRVIADPFDLQQWHGTSRNAFGR